MVASLLADLRRAGIRLVVEADRLRAIAPVGALTPGLAARIREHKAALVAALSPPAVLVLPVDEEIARTEAAKHSRADLGTRLARLEAVAATPGASDLDRQLAADWRAVLAAADEATSPPTERTPCP